VADEYDIPEVRQPAPPRQRSPRDLARPKRTIEVPENATRQAAPPQQRTDYSRGVEPYIQQAVSRMANSSAPESVYDRMRVVDAISSSLNLDPRLVERDVEGYASKLFNVENLPLSNADAVVRHLKIGYEVARLNNLNGRIARGRISGDDVSDLEKQAEKIRQGMPAPDQYARSLPISLLKSAAEVWPSMQNQILGHLALGAITPAGGAAGLAKLLVGIGRVGISAYTWNQLTGAAYEDIMSMEDEDGRRPDQERAARMAALAAIPQALVENLQINAIMGGKTITQKIAKKTWLDATVGNAAFRFAKNYAGRVAEEVVEEELQQWISIMARQFIINAENELGANFDKISAEQVIEEYKQTLFETAKAMVVLGAPGSVISTIREGQSERQRSAVTTDEKSRAENIETGDMATPENQRLERTVMEIQEEQQSVEAEIREMEDRVSAGMEPSAEEIESLYARAKDLDIELDDAVRSRRYVRDLPEGEVIDPRAELEGLYERQDLKEMFRNFPEFQRDPRMSDAAITVLWMRANAVGQDVDTYLQENPIRFATAEEFAQAAAETDPQLAAEAIEIEGATNVRGATLWMRDGTALVRATERADFTTFFHETVHIFRRQLASSDQEILANHYNLERSPSGEIVWTREADEAFVEEAQAAVFNGELQPDVAGVFQRIMGWLKRLAHLVTSRGWRASPEVRDVLSRMFSTTRLEQGAPVRPAPGMLLEEEKSFRKVEDVYNALSRDIVRNPVDLENIEQATEEMSSRIAEDLIEIIQGNSKVLDAKTWYSDAVIKYKNEISRELPELTDDANFKVFQALIGVTSLGQSVAENEAAAISMYKYWSRTGELPRGESPSVRA